MKKNTVILICFISVLSMFGCMDKNIIVEKTAEHINLIETSEYGHISLEFESLTGEDIRSFEVKKDKIYDFEYKYLITKASLKIQFKNSKDELIEEIILDSDEYFNELKKLKEENQNDSIQLIEIGRPIRLSSNDGEIKVYFIGDETEGKISIEW